MAVGMVVCVLAWALQLTPLLEGYQWWGTLIYGLAAGLSGCGFYDVVKAIAALFEKIRLKWNNGKSEGGTEWTQKW